MHAVEVVGAATLAVSSTGAHATVAAASAPSASSIEGRAMASASRGNVRKIEAILRCSYRKSAPRVPPTTPIPAPHRPAADRHKTGPRGIGGDARHRERDTQDRG
ncbi:hypothetical protein GCM10027203_77000 [Nonomuraea fastidiosa]